MAALKHKKPHLSPPPLPGVCLLASPQFGGTDLANIFPVPSCHPPGSYFHYSVRGGFTAPQARDITISGLFGAGDPMYVVFARKEPASS